MLRPTFGAGVKEHLAILEQAAQASPSHPGADDALASFATMVGALVLSRMVDDEDLSRRLLETAAQSVLGDEAPATAA
jgi:TetR/AcrR family transcriptional repressor of nem operon